jgi:hypothetical protein
VLELALRPAILPEESIVGYLQRLALLGTDGDMQMLAQRVLSIKPIHAPWLIPSHLETLASRFSDVLPSAQVLLEQHTIFPAVAPFLSAASQASVRDRMLGTSPPAGTYLLLGLQHSYEGPGSLKTTQAYCKTCASEDKDRFGFSYWRRHHQFPHVFSCGVHGTPLMTGSGCCAVTSRAGRHARLPQRPCFCKRWSKPVIKALNGEDARDVDRRVSRLLHQTLTYPLPQIDATVLGQVYRHRFEELGFLKGRNYMATPDASRAFVKACTSELLERCASRVSSENGWFSMAVRGNPPKSAVRNILLVNFLFGSLENFARETLRYRETTLAPRAKRARRKLPPAHPHAVNKAGTPEYIKRRREYRRMLTNWAAKVRVPTRTKAITRLGYIASRLWKHDEDWYQNALPPNETRTPSANSMERWDKARARADRMAVKHVRRRYKLLSVRNKRPVRITRRLLIDGLPDNPRPRPRANRLIARLVDTDASFRERLAIWLYSHPEFAPVGVSALKHASLRTGIGQQRICQLCTDAINVRLERPSRRRPEKRLKVQDLVPPNDAAHVLE